MTASAPGCASHAAGATGRRQLGQQCRAARGTGSAVDFIDGNIDRPVVIGALYNGQGQADAQHNQVAQGGGASTGNAPTWFPGESGGHAHPATLSGLKSQTLPASQGGAGAYSQLVFDDTPGQPRLGCNGTRRRIRARTNSISATCATRPTTSACSRLVWRRTQVRAQRRIARRTRHAAVGRLRNGGSGHQLDAREAQAQIEQAQALQTTLATTAQKQNAKLKSEPEPEKIPAIAQMGSSAQALSASGSGLAGDTGGGGQATAYSAALMQLSAPSGIAATTPASAVIAAGATSSMTAGQDINLLTQANSLHTVRDGISLFTYGKASSADKPNQETGIRLHAASGKVSSQSQNDATSLTADRLITVASVSKDVRMAAKEHVLLTAQGAYLKLEGGNIEVHGPGTMTFKASMKELTGPAQSTPALPELPNEKLYAGRFQVKDALAGTAIAGRLYRKQRADGKVFFGKTDAEGHTTPVNTAKQEQLAISFDHNEKFHREKIDEDEVNQWFS
jgi:uncharacterized protein (DUF2345 family)